MSEKVRFRGVEKKVLAKLAKDIVEMLESRAQTDKRWKFRRDILKLLGEKREVVATLVITTATFILTNIDNIKTKQLEGLVVDDKIIDETVQEVEKSLSYIT